MELHPLNDGAGDTRLAFGGKPILELWELAMAARSRQSEASDSERASNICAMNFSLY